MLRTYVVILLLMVAVGSVMSRMPVTSGASANAVSVEAAQSNAGASATEAAQQVSELDRSIELTRDSSGYFYADVRINGAPIHLLVDTGATDIALSRDDAHMAGIPTS